MFSHSWALIVAGSLKFWCLQLPSDSMQAIARAEAEIAALETKLAATDGAVNMVVWHPTLVCAHCINRLTCGISKLSGSITISMRCVLRCATAEGVSCRNMPNVKPS